MEYKSSKIISTDGLDSKVEFTFDDGTKSVQTLSNLAINDEVLVSSQLESYAKSFIAGKEVEKKVAEEGLIGKVLTPVIPETNPVDPNTVL